MGGRKEERGREDGKERKGGRKVGEREEEKGKERKTKGKL